MNPVSAADFRAAARRRLPPFLFEYIDGGAYDELTMRRNAEDLGRIELEQRVLRDVSNIDTATRLFGRDLAMPVILGPVGLAGMNARRGEVLAARAATSAGVPFTLSTVSVCPIGEVAEECSGRFWFQLYMVRDRSFMKDLLEQARDAGCTTLVFTVDMPVPGTRYRDYRSGLAGASGLGGSLRRVGQAIRKPRWALDVGLLGRPHSLGNVAPILGTRTGLEDFFAWMRDNFDPSATWDDLQWVRAHWAGELIVKGILCPQDAREAVRAGADGVVVSNHGGRQLDGVATTAKALPAIAAEVGNETTVLADGGVRSGLDVVRMISLGAKGVLLGRAWAFALAADGERGVRTLLDTMSKEMRVAMALTGRTSFD